MSEDMCRFSFFSSEAPAKARPSVVSRIQEMAGRLVFPRPQTLQPIWMESRKHRFAAFRTSARLLRRMKISSAKNPLKTVA
ncbi:hypothetical protein [Herbaspirillum chlorophenolicum]|jgi:hypothetical protein|uniref:hypothetical protein n=1 Tax=Herbaspirillum chlorophenolicum TaxID=211589 RepID=UPI0012E15CC9|nr:hypothetical protein [Herbaspirillum chlorophenolicum]